MGRVQQNWSSAHLWQFVNTKDQYKLSAVTPGLMTTNCFRGKMKRNAIFVSVSRLVRRKEGLRPPTVLLGDK